jgi:cytochrome c oxidase cbb3-type subunit 3
MLGFTYMAVGGTKGGLNGDIVNILTIAAAVVLVVVTVFVVIKYVRQMQTDTASGELADENWDGIGEYKNELPMGWSILFLLTLVWSAWYFFIGYPVNAYSQIGEYNEDSAAHNAKFEAKYASITGDSLVDMGESVFLAECKVCHGLTADGIDGKAANLNQRLEAKSVKHVVENGSNFLGFAAPMPDRNGLFNMNTGALITDAEIASVAEYVANGMQGAGADTFAGTCAACHGAEGTGMDFVAPNIASFDTKTVKSVLDHGKKGAIGTMPAFTRLNDKQKEAVGAYISSISK